MATKLLTRVLHLDVYASVLIIFIHHHHGSNNKTIIVIITSPPQSHLGRACCEPHVGECTLPLRVLAVACTMRNEALQSVTGRYVSVTRRYRTLRKRYMGCCGALWNIT